MRIIHIALGGCLTAPPVSYGLTEDTGGHIAYVLGAAAAQARRGNVEDVTIVTRAFDAPALGADFARTHQRLGPGLGIRRLRTGQAGYLSKEALEAELPALTEAFLALLEQGRRPDVIHAHFADAAELAAAAERRFGIPWLYSAHSLGAEKLCPDTDITPALQRRIDRERRAIRGAHAIIASSRDEAERQIAGYDTGAAGRTHRVNPGVTLEGAGCAARGRALVAPFLRDADKPVILAIARPIRKKNLVALIEAYAAAPDLQDRANLVIAAGQRPGLSGGGAEQDAVIAGLFDAVDRHDLWGRVALPRRHAPAEVPDLYALARQGGVFCNPALHEPFGLTLIEAARAGVPVVATRNGGPGDIVGALGDGALVDPADPRDIAEGLLAVLDAPDRAACGTAAQARAARLFDWDGWAARVQAVHDGLRTPDRAAVACPHLLASDIDDTLTGDAQAARQFADLLHAGHLGGFAVATGRSVSEARRVLAEWAIPEPAVMITSVGSEIWRRRAPGRYALCPDYARRLNADWKRGAIAARLGTLGATFQPACDQRRWKLSLFGDAAEGDRIRAALHETGLAARVIASHGRFIDILPAAAGKAAAVRFEARRRGLPDKAVIVAGDSANDEDMLTTFPNAILPASARAELDHLRGPYRAPRAHAAGVLDGLRHFGITHPLSVAAE